MIISLSLEDEIAAIVVDFDINSPAGIIIVKVVDLVDKGDFEYACSASLLDTLSDKSDCVVAVVVGGIKIDLSSSCSASTCVVVFSGFNDLCEVIVYFWGAIGEFPAEFAGFICNENFVTTPHPICKYNLVSKFIMIATNQCFKQYY